MKKSQNQRLLIMSKPLRKVMVFSLALLFTLLAGTAPVLAQGKTISGRVTNDANQPVAGASVVVKGTTNGTTTDNNGNFSIQAPSGGTLVISSINFAEKEIAVGNSNSINVKLSTSIPGDLGEVVVVGYGTQRKKDVTGAVVSVKGETLREVPAPNLINQLKGRTAGVDIVSNSATPGGGGTIRIRGNRSMATTANQSDGLDQPLVVLDGIPFGGSINDINPEDVASLEILKDASATAIYGSRGAGGVILVTTKKGKPGKAIISYDAYHGISKIMDKLNVFTGPEYAAFKDEARLGNNTSPGTSSYALTPAESAALAAGVSTDWQDLIYRQGFMTNHQLGVSGGNESTQFSLSGNYFNEAGIIPNQNFERFTLRTSVDHRFNSKLRVGLISTNTLTYSNTPGGNGVPGGLIRMTPLANPYNTDGSVNLLPAIGSTDATAVSPLTLITKSDAIVATNRRIRTFNSFYGEYEFFKGLRYRLNVGLDFRQDQGGSYNGPLTYTNTATSFAQANAQVNNQEAWAYTVENLLDYNVVLREKHRIGVTGLFSVQKDHQQQSSFNGTGFPADFVQYSNLALANTVVANPNAGTNGINERGLVSYMARVNYGFDDRYLLTATVRRDGSSVLSEGNQYFTYPAFALGWNIMNENFMENLSWLTNLKIRGGWGKTSNQGIAPYTTLGALGVSNYNFGLAAPGQQFALVFNSLPNPDLKWQSTSQWNIGLDFGLFKNRVTGSVDVYEQRTKDILLSVNLPQSNGAGSITKNLGKTKGNGLEVNLSSINVQTKSGFTWNTDINYYFNREEIVELTTPTEKANIGNGWFVGQPLTVIYDVKKIGIWQTKDASQLAAQTTPVQFVGQIRVEDVNKDNRIDANDRQILGNFQPTWEGGITNRFAFKGVDLSIVMFARMGMKVLVPYLTADGGANGFPFFNQSRVNQVKVDYWTPSNPTNEFPRPDAGTDRFVFASTLGYRDGSFIKCRSINLGYEIPSKPLNRVGIRSLRVYVTAVNPFILYSPFVDDGFGPDPEGNGFGGAVTSPSAGSSTGAPGRQISVNANNPSTRQFLVGMNLKF
jgi:TonB-dependent starch-binding outer membrane protein SusC